MNQRRKAAPPRDTGTCLVRTCSVLDCTGGGFGDVDFGTHPEDADDSYVGTRVTLPRRTWLALGAPGQLTVTIDPGNTLDPRSRS